MEGAQGEKLVGAKMQARNASMECEERSAELGIIYVSVVCCLCHERRVALSRLPLCALYRRFASSSCLDIFTVHFAARF